MVAAILGKKVGMTQIFDENGTFVPVTVVEAGPCPVLQVKTSDGPDGYDAVQLGFDQAKPKRTSRAMIAHAGKAGSSPVRFVREVRLPEPTEQQPGELVTVGVFEEREIKFVDVTGTSKGRGFTGAMKRHGFGGQPASHGVERKHRSTGSVGGSSPGALGRGIRKGKRMSGHAGHARCTVRNNELVGVDKENNVLLIRGSIPGPNGSYVVIRESKTKR